MGGLYQHRRAGLCIGPAISLPCFITAHHQGYLPMPPKPLQTSATRFFPPKLPRAVDRVKLTEAILVLRYQDRLKGTAKGRIYNDAQTSAGRLLSFPLSQLRSLIELAEEYKRTNNSERLIPYHLGVFGVKEVLKARHVAQLPRSTNLLAHAYYLAFRAGQPPQPANVLAPRLALARAPARARQLPVDSDVDTPPPPHDSTAIITHCGRCGINRRYP